MARIRTLTIGVAVAALVATAVPAGAAETTFAARAASAGLTLDLAGTDLLDLGATRAAIVPGEARAIVAPLALGGTPVGDRDAQSDGPRVTDPAAGSDRCEGVIPAPLSSIIGAGLSCGDASAEGDVLEASATGGVAELSVLNVDSAQLGDLTHLLATLPLDAILDPVQAELDGELAGLLDQVGDACVSALGVLNLDGGGEGGSLPGDLDGVIGELEGVLDGLGLGGLLGGGGDGGGDGDAGGLLDPVVGLLSTASAADPLTDLLGQLTDVLDSITGTLPVACDVLGDLTDALTGGDLLIDLTSGELLGALAGAEGALTVTLLATESAVARDGDTVHAAAGPADGGAVRIALDIPLLDDLLEPVLVGAIAPVLSELQTLLAPLNDVTSDIPVVGDLVSSLLTEGTIGELVDGPLLAVGVAPGSATATGDLGTEETSGTATNAVVTLDGSLFALPVLAGLDDGLNDVSRRLDTALLSELRATPLVDLVSVTLLPRSVEDTELEGLAGTLATSGTASVQVLSAIGDPLIDLDAAPATAAVGVGPLDGTTPGGPGVPVVPSGPDGPSPASPSQPGGPTSPDGSPARPGLPATGGGAALLGLAALGAAATLRRRG